jgi:hypothetical protein
LARSQPLKRLVGHVFAFMANFGSCRRRPQGRVLGMSGRLLVRRYAVRRAADAFPIRAGDGLMARHGDARLKLTYSMLYCHLAHERRDGTQWTQSVRAGWGFGPMPRGPAPMV